MNYILAAYVAYPRPRLSPDDARSGSDGFFPLKDLHRGLGILPKRTVRIATII